MPRSGPAFLELQSERTADSASSHSSSGDGSRLDDQRLRRVPSDILKGSDGSL